MIFLFRVLIPIFDPSVKAWSRDARILRWLTFLWLALGLILLFSASYIVGLTEYGNGLHYFKSQLIWIFLGLTGFNIIVHLPLRSILLMAQFCIFALLVLIFATLIPGLGVEVNGASRWLYFGSLGIQPSELIKPCLVLQAAVLFGRWSYFAPTIRWFWLATFASVLGLILLQPNLSTAALCGMVMWCIALASGLSLRYVGTAALSGLGLAIVSVSFQEYQRRRILSFLNPWQMADGDGYQLVQSLLAIGSGGIWGRGLGLSQQKLFYLPIQYTDFIFAVFAEEFGFIGCVIFLCFLGVYGTLGLRVAVRTAHPVYQLVAIGCVTLLIGQSILNIGVATGALPTTGLPLPLISYGGSSMLSSLMTAGLLVRVARECDSPAGAWVGRAM
ncbi:MAG: FtsW/RodA/SpoVE family cell cycle protein [Cyanothece sp. SIO2G6]|nr:FtsW/RodA/SpoVE family cell cycle protein [Cyanothece sp. SIO2G6]